MKHKTQFQIGRKDLKMLLSGLESCIGEHEIGPDDMKKEKALAKKIANLLKQKEK